VAIAKAGGLNREEAKGQGIDPAEFGRRGSGIMRVFTKHGESFDAMAEKLAQYGYPVLNEQGNFDLNRLLDAVQAELAGNKQHSASVSEAKLEEMLAPKEGERGPPSANESIFGPSEPDDFGISDALADAAEEDPDAAAIAEARIRARTVLSPDQIDAIEERVAIASEGESDATFEAAFVDALEEAIDEAKNNAGHGEGEEAGAQGPAAGGPAEEVLQSYTEEELRERARKEEEARKKREEEARKAEADRLRGDFVLSASNRPADINAAHGQKDMLDQAASEAASSHENELKEPSQEQKEAENYKKGHISNLDGHNISIENPRGSYRFKIDEAALKEIAKEDGPGGKDATDALDKLTRNQDVPAAFRALKESSDPRLKKIATNGWFNQMNSHYGYFKGTVGHDKDHVDVFLGPRAGEEDPGPYFVVDQINPETGAFDESKVMMGFGSASKARAAYLGNYDKGWNGLDTVTEFTRDQFRAWIYDKEQTGRPAHDAKEHGEVSASGRRQTKAAGPVEKATVTEAERSERRGFKFLESSYTWTKTVTLGDSRAALANVRQGGKGFGVTVSVRDTSGQVTGAPSRALGTFETLDQAMDAAEAELAKLQAGPATEAEADLSEKPIKIKQTFKVKETGEKVEVEENAADLLAEADDRLDRLHALRNCIGAG